MIIEDFEILVLLSFLPGLVGRRNLSISLYKIECFVAPQIRGELLVAKPLHRSNDSKNYFFKSAYTVFPEHSASIIFSACPPQPR